MWFFLPTITLFLIIALSRYFEKTPVESAEVLNFLVFIIGIATLVGLGSIATSLGRIADAQDKIADRESPE